MIMYSRYALQTRTREQNLHSISVRTNWQRKLQSSTTVLMYIHQVLKQNSLKKQRIRDFEVVAEEAFTADSKTDFSTQLKKAQDGGAELVFLPIYYTEASIILTQADQMGYQPKFFGCDGLDGLLAVKNFDTKLAEGVMLLTPFAAMQQMI